MECKNRMEEYQWKMLANKQSQESQSQQTVGRTTVKWRRKKKKQKIK